MIRLSEGWSLTDGIVQPLALSEPRSVVSALTEAGLLRDPEKGLGSLSCEWISARRWTYGLSFACPEEDRQRAFYLENLCGEGCVRLNGRKLADFCDQSLWADCTQALLPGENRLEVVFEPRLRPMPGWDALPEVGLCGGVFLHESCDVRIESLSARRQGDSLLLSCRLARRRGVEYAVRFRILCGEQVLAEREIPVRLKERCGEASCEVRLPGVPAWSERRPEEGVLTVEAEARRQETLCDRAELCAVMGCERPLRVAQVDAFRADAQTNGLLERLGAQACVLLRAHPGRQEGGLCGGIPSAGYATCAPGSAMQREQLLTGLCGEADAWPPEESALWRLRAKVQDMPDAELCARPMPEVCRYQRAMQAENLRALAEERRLRGEELQVRLNDQDWKISSGALVDADGEERAAYWALMQAWDALHAAVFFRGDGVYEVDLLSDGTRCDVVSVRAAAYDCRGALLSEREFIALSDRTACLGEWRAPFPEGEELILVRTEMKTSDGEPIETCDRLVFATDDPEARLKRLTRDPVELEQDGEALKNSAQTACLCLRAGEAYGFLLPGEKRGSARLSHAEWINREE